MDRSWKATRRRSRPTTKRKVLIDMAFPMVPRVPVDFPINKLEATQVDIDRLRATTEEVVPTSGAVLAWAPQVRLERSHSFVVDPILALLRIVQIDSTAFFQNLEFALEEISRDSLDDYLMNRRLAEWRRLMSDFEMEVPTIGNSVRDFVRFVFRQDRHQSSNWAQPSSSSLLGAELPMEVEAILKDLNDKTIQLKVRLDEAYAALRSDMQFTESRRSIEETKSLSKLIELAFLFIPLSFICSLFSMSISELQSGVPSLDLCFDRCCYGSVVVRHPFTRCKRLHRRQFSPCTGKFLDKARRPTRSKSTYYYASLLNY